MGSRMHASRSLPFEKPEDLGERTPVAGSKTWALLHRIATALQVPASALVEPADLISASDTNAATTPTGASMAGECVALVRAYSGISDPAERLRLLDLVRRASEQA